MTEGLCRGNSSQPTNKSESGTDHSVPLLFMLFMLSKREADQSLSRAGACSRRNISLQSLYYAKQNNFSVGYGACDVPNRFHSIPPKREANETNCGGGVSAEECSSRYLSDIYHLNAKQINSSVGTTIGRPRNDGHFRYRKQ